MNSSCVAETTMNQPRDQAGRQDGAQREERSCWRARATGTSAFLDLGKEFKLILLASGRH